MHWNFKHLEFLFKEGSKAVNICVSSLHKTLIEIAVDVFKSQNLALVRSLKDFLTVLSSPNSIEEVLAAAIYQLAETEPEACRWLLNHASCLEPELDLAELAMKLARTSLQNQYSISTGFSEVFEVG